MRTIEEIKLRRDQLKADEKKFTEFLSSVYNDADAEEKINLHMWRIRKEIEVLNWITKEELPF